MLCVDQIIGDVCVLQDCYNVIGFLVVDEIGCVVGIVINCDMCFVSDDCMLVSVVMIGENLVILNEFVDCVQVISLMKECWIEKLLIINCDGKLIGLLMLKDIEQVVLNFLVCKDDLGCLCVVVVLIVGDEGFECSLVLVDVGVDMVVIDIVYGYFEGVVCVVVCIKFYFNEVQVVVGNVVIVEVVCVLVDVGVDVVKVGIGFGLICIMCIVVGVGVL